MRDEVVDIFRPMGISGRDEIKTLFDEQKVFLLTKKQLFAAESAWKKHVISEGGVCKRCGREDMLTVDHNIPKWMLADFGIDFEREFMPSNLVLLCRPCNAVKSGHLDFSLPQTKELLLELLANL